MYARAAKLYREVDLNSASKVDVLGRLYGRLLTDLRTASDCIESSDIAGRAEACNHAFRITTELTAALDYDVAPELCANLAALYDYVQSCIATATVDLKVAPLKEAIDVVEVLRDAFQEASGI